jgi:diaminopropionate ammonia-lyase
VIKYFANPRATRDALTEGELAVVSLRAARAARAELLTWPRFAPTPLHELAQLARANGIAALLYKDESQRLGLGSFKALGGAYAAGVAIRERLAAGSAISAASLTLACATDGNHGRSVAYAARRHGCSCVVYMHESAPADKAAAIQALGALIVRTAGTYDDSVRIARAAAKQPDWLLVPDTSDDPADPTPARVMQGYGVMALELIDELETPPTHVFVQAGVGGLAAAIAGNFAEAYGARRPMCVVVEPERAACVFASAVLGHAATIDGPLDTEMAMLSCGEASRVAWPVLDRRADAFIAIDDDAAVHWTRQLRSGAAGMPLDVGVSGAAGLAGLQCALADPSTKRALGLDADSRVVVIGTEGAPPRS